MSIFDTYQHRWHVIADGDVIETATSWLYPVVYHAMPAMLKIFKQNSDERSSGEVLACYDGCGSVRLLASSEDAILMERVSKVDLSKERDDAVATGIFCHVLQELHRCKRVPSGIRNVSVLEKDFDAYPEPEGAHAKKLFQKLVATTSEQVLLHGDLHHYNILYDNTRNRWCAIDPKGYVGDPLFEVGAFLHNPLYEPDRYDSEDLLQRRIAEIAERCGFDPVRLREWCYVRMVLALCWGFEEGLYRQVVSRLKRWLAVDIEK